MTEAQLLPVIWTLASMTAAVLATLLISPARLSQLRLSLGGRFLEQFFRLLYFVGLPYAALLTRAISPIDMGLSGASGPILGWTAAEWLHGLGNTLLVGVLALLPLSWASWQIAKAGLPLKADDRTAGAVMVDAIYSEVHWAFYRAAPLILLSEVYGAMLVGALLVATEWLVVLVRNGLSNSVEERQTWLRRSAFLALSATLFILTRNAWLIIGFHVVSEVVLKGWLAKVGRIPGPARETSLPAPPTSHHDSDVRPLHEHPPA